MVVRIGGGLNTGSFQMVVFNVTAVLVKHQTNNVGERRTKHHFNNRIKVKK